MSQSSAKGTRAEALSVKAAARQCPTQPLLIQGTTELNAGAVAQHVTRIQSSLSDRGISPGQPTPVAFKVDNTLECALLLLALIDAKVPCVPLHSRWTEAECQRLLQEIDADLALAGTTVELSPEEVQSLGHTHPGAPIRHSGVAIDDASRPDLATPSVSDEHLLAILHTSGSVGRPRGVKLSRRAFLRSAEASARNLGWQPDDRWLLNLPLAHVGGLSILTRCLCARRAIVLPDLTSSTAQSDAYRDQLAQALRHRVTLMSLVPTQVAQFVAQGAPPPALRAVIVGGAAISALLLQQARNAGWPLLTSYGATETCSQVVTQNPCTPPGQLKGCGRALFGVELKFLDGHLCVRSDTLLSGYVGDPSPALKDGWFVTSDQGELDADGNLHVHGRADDVVISGGENIQPLEVEHALCRHPLVREACAFGIPHPVWGQQLCAVLVLEQASESDSDATPSLRQTEGLALSPPLASVLSSLARFKHPKHWRVVSRLPTTATGKLDRQQTRRDFESWRAASAGDFAGSQEQSTSPTVAYKASK